VKWEVEELGCGELDFTFFTASRWCCHDWHLVKTHLTGGMMEPAAGCMRDVKWCLDEVMFVWLLKVDDEKVVSGSYDKTLKVWDIKTGQCRRTLRSPPPIFLLWLSVSCLIRLRPFVPCYGDTEAPLFCLISSSPLIWFKGPFSMGT